ncbi:MAG: ATP-binding protein, partial [Planctomycetota bacterium]
ALRFVVMDWNRRDPDAAPRERTSNLPSSPSMEDDGEAEQPDHAAEHADGDPDTEDTFDADFANRALRDSTAIQDKFLAMLSHELRTPLTPALISISQLQHTVHTDFGDDPRLARPIAVARRSIETEVRIIEDLLDLLRVNRGKLRVRREKFDLCAAVREVATVFEQTAEQKGVAFTIDLPDEPAAVDGDRRRLEQVFWNVLDNAVKFTDSGSIRVVGRLTGAGTIEVDVIDTGVGITAEALPRVFFAFEQGGSGADEDAEEGDGRYGRTRIDGLGLGLALSKAIVDLHNGRLRARSSGLSKGSTFTVELLRADHDGPVGATPFDRTTEHHAGQRILLVDDHVDTASAMGRLLRKFGHEVTTVGSVASALEAIGAGAFDVLISDIGLPDGTGFDLIRQVPEPLRQRSIAVSGFGAPGDLRESASAGFREHLVKPITLEALNAAVKRARGRTTVSEAGEEA